MQALVIDDSRAMRMILRRMLADLGASVVEATDGRDGLDQLSSGLAPDVVLVDWNMPTMSGIEFVEAVRLDPYRCEARIVMVTTETETARVAEALRLGADEYLMKPFSKESLEAKLELLGVRST